MKVPMWVVILLILATLFGTIPGAIAMVRAIISKARAAKAAKEG